ncbi:MAG: D-alanine--D-alanine ligase [Anaerolineae bacterium]|nr:D-alanine--D-alanine ligase [Anaerolineae bacterium]
MSVKRKTTVGVIFGGRSVEHDVSVVTGHQIMNAFDAERYEVVPIYIDRDGAWFTGAPLREIKPFQGDVTKLDGVLPTLLSPNVRQHGLIVNPTPGGLFGKSQVMRLDVAFPAIHGSHGEDGTLQGLFEMADIPYVGCGVLASAVANDKLLAKDVLRQAGIPVIDAIGFTRAEWQANPDAIISQITTKFSYPVFIKPATLGSSIGIGRAEDETLLRAFIDVAANLDRRLLVEGAVTECLEINCSVLGDANRLQASVLEQPVSWEQFLTYEEKYLRGGEGMKSADRIIPAPLSDDLTKRIQDIAMRAFRAIDGRGIARIDFLVRPERDEIFLNELNTLPGSLSFYLWEPTGIKPRELVDRLVTLAQDAYAEKRRSTYNYQTNLIALTASRGLKGIKK